MYLNGHVVPLQEWTSKAFLTCKSAHICPHRTLPEFSYQLLEYIRSRVRHERERNSYQRQKGARDLERGSWRILASLKFLRTTWKWLISALWALFSYTKELHVIFILWKWHESLCNNFFRFAIKKKRCDLQKWLSRCRTNWFSSVRFSFSYKSRQKNVEVHWNRLTALRAN